MPIAIYIRETTKGQVQTSPKMDRTGSSMTQLVYCSDQTIGTGSHFGPGLVRTVETTALTRLVDVGFSGMHILTPMQEPCDLLDSCVRCISG